MFSLFSHSCRYAKRIFWYSVLEWTLFLVVAGVVFYYVSFEPLLAILATPAYFVMGLVLLPLSQIRGVLIELGQTDTLELGKINSTFRLLLRFFGVAFTLPAAGSLLIIFLLHMFGYTEGINLQGLAQDPELFIGTAITNLFSQPVLWVGLSLIPIMYLFCFTSCMVPLAAVGANLGSLKREYDPFYGFGAYRYRAFMLTLVVLILDVVIVLGSAYLVFKLTPPETYLALASGETPSVPILASAVLIISFLAQVFVQNIWFSACALLFTLYNEDAHSRKEAEVDEMYGYQFDADELRSLRKSRER